MYLTTGLKPGEDEGAIDDTQGATNAQVQCQIFGDDGDTGPIPLGLPRDEFFQAGATDKFDVRC